MTNCGHDPRLRRAEADVNGNVRDLEPQATAYLRYKGLSLSPLSDSLGNGAPELLEGTPNSQDLRAIDYLRPAQTYRLKAMP
jgi:hypothetical protein